MFKIIQIKISVKYVLNCPELDRHLACSMSITFTLTAGIVTAGSYWAGAIEEKQQQFIKYNC